MEDGDQCVGGGCDECDEEVEGDSDDAGSEEDYLKGYIEADK